MACSLPGFSVHGILQARVLEWVAMRPSRGPSRPRDQPTSPVSTELAGRFFTTNTIWEVLYEVPRGVKFIEPESINRMVGAGTGGGGCVFNGNRVSIWDNDKVPEMAGGDGCPIG